MPKKHFDKIAEYIKYGKHKGLVKTGLVVANLVPAAAITFAAGVGATAVAKALGADANPAELVGAISSFAVAGSLTTAAALMNKHVSAFFRKGAAAVGSAIGVVAKLAPFVPLLFNMATGNIQVTPDNIAYLDADLANHPAIVEFVDKAGLHAGLSPVGSDYTAVYKTSSGLIIKDGHVCSSTHADHAEFEEDISALYDGDAANNASALADIKAHIKGCKVCNPDTTQQVTDNPTQTDTPRPTQTQQQEEEDDEDDQKVTVTIQEQDPEDTEDDDKKPTTPTGPTDDDEQGDDEDQVTTTVTVTQQEDPSKNVIIEEKSLEE
ncbi:MAG: hypothetical protein IKA31_04395 [Clostridia bacterium]|nr:hypothetical protein [Clostridia bacterium]